ncbi:DUF4450 domain-containing protein [Parabacteroides sp. OttesenSCG-928-J18]|nr:DUF4450 domain-containing protein [Parabacteroides sp. OttesenSCG-928-J18]
MKHYLLGAALSLCLVSACSQKTEQTPRYWQGKERELRYHPEGEEFVINNGTKRFNRAIYGTNTGFRFETSDYPEFGLYMPRLGGSVYMAISTPSETVWVKDLASIESRFKSGQRTYIMRDSRILGDGLLILDAVALSDADGLVVRYQTENLPEGLKIHWIYGGANNQRFSREGDLGVDPEDSFFIKAENCLGNQYEMTDNRFTLSYATSNQLTGLFPTGATLRLGDARLVDSLPELLHSEPSEKPVILAEHILSSDPFYFELHNPKSHADFAYSDLEQAFNNGVAYRTEVASTMKLNTPDPFINTLGGIFSGAEDAVWEDPGYLHGAIGWRVPLTGWRAAYLADLMGRQDRARTHFNGYINSQVTNRPATLPHSQDQELHLARPAKIWGTPMYSNGYICRTPNTTNTMHHYDMNLVFIDELLWHLNWTGDMTYAREIFPVLQRHLAWEKNAFDPDGDSLYDAVCCIWASDGLQYNGGKVTHSSAYNYRANRMTAEIARKIGEDPTRYEEEAARILAAMNRELWISEKGWWAEFVDVMGHGMRHDNAGLWSIYHAIDSEVHDPFQAYQATRYVDTELPHIPVIGKGLKETDNYVVATTNWQPYDWSINNVAFAENAHTALSFWQAGRGDEAFKILKGTILDAMYLGSGPGNITQVSFYDAARGEIYRDFSDPVAMGVRAVVQGMYGIIPDLINNRLVIRPGFPEDWDFADIKTKNMAYSFKRTGHTEQYTIEPDLPRENVQLIMELNAPTNKVKRITVNGQEVSYTLAEEAISMPKIRFDAGIACKYDIIIEWAGDKILNSPLSATIANGEELSLKLPFAAGEIYDPQAVLSNERVENGLLSGLVNAQEGHRTLFVRVATGEMSYWRPVDIKVVKRVELINRPEAETLQFLLVNNSDNPLTGELFLNHKTTGQSVNIAAHAQQAYSFASPLATLGSNKVEIRSAKALYTLQAINWHIANPSGANYQKVDMQAAFNDRVRDIFQFGKYLTPRHPYTTHQVPTQGMGQWCHPTRLSSIDDTGIRRIAASQQNSFTMPQGIPFATPGGSDAPNILFTTLWDNYPTQASLPLNGKASKAYLLVAGSTYHMQCHVLNGQIRITYKDGTQETLELKLPDNLLPLDQDIFIDGWVFNSPQPRPWRVSLKTGAVSRYHARDLGIEMSNNPLYIDGGLATLLDLPLDPEKELESLTIETIANEVIIGLMGVTLLK